VGTTQEPQLFSETVNPSRLLIYDSHPVHYKAPIYKQIARTLGNDLLVVYATDCSVRGRKDPSFGETFAWDVPLLSGYSHEILNCEHGEPLKGFFSLRSWNVFGILQKFRPSMVLLSQLSYCYDFQVILSAWALRIPVFVRIETQDEANVRSSLKTALREVVLRSIYSFLAGAFWIGKLNLAHLRVHGMREKILLRTPYCAETEVNRLSPAEAARRRAEARKRLGISEGVFCVGFFGKLIPKKDPQILFRIAELIPITEQSHYSFLFVGAGELRETLNLAAEKTGVPSYFSGFVNLSKIADYYLATDVLILPSQRMGETWGLVVNEALAAGCRVLMSEAVGSHAEFQSLGAVSIFPVSDAKAAWEALQIQRERSQSAPRESHLPTEYTTENVAEKIVAFLGSLNRPAV